MRRTLTTLVFLLPASRTKNRLLRWLGHDISPGARIGICLVRNVRRFELGDGALIGHFNWFSGLDAVRMGRGAQVMMFNLILGVADFELADADPATARTLQLADDSHIMSQNYLDCVGGLILSEQAWITGVRNTVLTHAFDPHDGGMITEPVIIGTGAVISTCCTILPGVRVGEGALVAAGSTLWTRQQVAADNLSGGVPARRLGPITIAR